MGESTTIYPTHECFDDAVEIVARMLEAKGISAISEIKIVHGIIAPDGVDIAHAWVERAGKYVVFAGILCGERVIVEGDLEDYYRESVVKDRTTYTLAEAAAEEVRCGHGGPWVDRYIALCKDKDTNNDA